MACAVCEEEIDTNLFHSLKYQACTICFDLIQDVMDGYLFNIISEKIPATFDSYIEQLHNEPKIAENKYPTPNAKIRHILSLSRISKWIADNPAFYDFYFSYFLVCKNCGQRMIPQGYKKQANGDWTYIICKKCGERLKKIFLPLKI